MQVYSSSLKFSRRIFSRTSPDLNASGLIESTPASASKDAYLKDKEHKAAVRKYTKLRENLEKTLAELEEKIKTLDSELQSPDNTADYAKVQSLFEEKTAAEEELSEKEMEYLECLEMLENLGE